MPLSTLLVLLTWMVIATLPAVLHSAPQFKQINRTSRIKQIELVAVLGQGELNESRWSPDGKRIASATSVGVWMYPSLQDRPHLLGGDVEPAARIAFSPDGKFVAVANQVGKVTLWDAATEKKVRTLPYGQSTVYSLAFSPDSSLLALGSSQDTIVWEVESGKFLGGINNSGASFITLGNQQIFTADPKTGSITAWNTVSQRPDWTIRTLPMTSVSLNRDGSILATGDARGVIRLWDVIKQRTILTISTHLEPVADMAFSPDGTHLASVGGQAIRVWNAQTGAPIDLLEKPKHLSTSVEHPGWLSRPPTWTINRIVFSPDGRQIVANSQFAIWIWDAHTGKITAQLEEGNTDSVTDLAFNASHTLVASRSWTKIVVWKLPQGTPAASIDLDTEFYFYHVAFAPGTDKLFWHTRYMGLDFLDARTGEKGKLFADNSVREFAFSPDGTQLAVGLEGEIRIVDPKTMKQILVFPVGKIWVEALAFNLDGRLLTALVGDVVKVWNLSTGKEVAANALQSGYVDYTLEFDRQDRVWLVDTHSKKVEPTLEVHTGKTWPRETEGHSFAFTPDGSMKAVVNCEGGIDLIETATGNVLRTFGEVNCGRWEESNSLAFSPDGSILVSGTGAHHLGYKDPDGDGALRFWDTATGQEVATLRYSSDIDVIRFSPDGSLIAVGSENHVAAIWAITEKR